MPNRRETFSSQWWEEDDSVLLTQLCLLYVASAIWESNQKVKERKYPILSHDYLSREDGEGRRWSRWWRKEKRVGVKRNNKALDPLSMRERKATNGSRVREITIDKRRGKYEEGSITAFHLSILYWMKRDAVWMDLLSSCEWESMGIL